MEGIGKVIEELGLIILSKDIEIEIKQNEIDKLKKTIENLEIYLDTYDTFCNKDKDKDKKIKIQNNKTDNVFRS